MMFRKFILFLFFILFITNINNSYVSIKDIEYDKIHNNIDKIYKEININKQKLFVEKEKEAYYSIPKKYRKFCGKLGTELGIPFQIIYKWILNESSWRENVISGPNKNGSMDIGLAQINTMYIYYYTKHYFNGKPCNSFNVYNPYHNLELGLRHLSHLYETYNNWEKAIMAYNCGRTALNTGRIPDITKIYVKRILEDFICIKNYSI